MDTKQILETIAEYEASTIYHDLVTYKEYYEVKNPDVMRRWAERNRRGKTPNWRISTPYYATVIDTMAGYMFSDVEYESDNDKYETELTTLLEALHISTTDMTTGTYALAYNRAYELIYSEGEGKVNAKLTNLDPLTVIPIYDDSIEQKMTAVIWKRKSGKETLIDYIDKGIWEYYKIQKGDDGMDKLVERIKPKQLYFSRCPVLEYRSELIGEAPPFSVVISYIAALDWAITGNSNELDRVMDALLIIGKKVAEEDADHMDEWKFLDDISKDEMTPQYITKNLSAEFRKYVTDLLISEIHKHTHVINWNDPNIMGGEASARALKIRLFDMQMFSNRIEKIYKLSLEERITLLGELSSQINQTTSPEPSKITLKRTIPTDMETLMQGLAGVDYLSDQTKIGLLGLDWEVEKARLEEEAPEISLDSFVQEPIIDNTTDIE